MRLRLAIIAIFSSCLLYGQSTIFVLNENDSGPGSLRQALADASSGDTIRFREQVSSISLSSDELVIGKSVVIYGNPPHTTVTRQGSAARFRIFRIESPEALRVEFINLNISNGYAPDGDETAKNGRHGGGVFTSGSVHHLIFRDCLITYNQAGDGWQQSSSGTTGIGGSGGGIYSLSDLELYNCRILNNSAGKGADSYNWSFGSIQNAGGGGSGGGIYSGKDLLIEDCVIDSNCAGAGGRADGNIQAAGGTGGDGGNGGGVYNQYASVSIINSEFEGNSGGTGGGSYSPQDYCTAGAGGNGGAVYVYRSTVLIKASAIRENFSGNGGPAAGNPKGYGMNGGNGGGVCAISSHLETDSVEFFHNHTGAGGASGGGFYVAPGNGGHGGGIYCENTGIRINGCQFSENYTGNGAELCPDCYHTGGAHGGSGGGIYSLSALSNSIIVNCRFIDNITGDGGSLYNLDIYNHSPIANGGNGGGIASVGPLAEIVNCIFSGNQCGKSVFHGTIPPPGSYFLPRGGSGGGMYLKQSGVRIINNTVSNNHAGNAVILETKENSAPFVPGEVLGGGGGIYSSGVPIIAGNSIIALNYFYNDSLFNDIAGEAELSYCLLSADTLATIKPGSGNLIGIDPGFVTFPDDLQLSSSSPAVDHGSPDTTGLYLPQTDLNGNPRICNDVIDMGAYEFQGGHGKDKDRKEMEVTASPNPVKQETLISARLEGSDELIVSVFNTSAMLISQFSLGSHDAGIVSFIWETYAFSSGIYLIRIDGSKYTGQVKLIVLK